MSVVPAPVSIPKKEVSWSIVQVILPLPASMLNTSLLRSTRLGLLLLSLWLPLPVFSQSVDLPISHEAYGFLERMEADGLLHEYRAAVKPLTRREIAAQLLSLDSLTHRLTRYETEELSFLMGEFSQEAYLLQPERRGDIDRWRPATVPLKGGKMFVGLNGSYQTRLVEGKNADNRQVGVQLFGNVFERVGFFFNFVSLRETGPLVSMAKLHSPEQGVPFFNTPDNVGGYEYNTVEAALSYDFGGISISLEKSNNVWGEERYGNVILSSKSPSFPKVKLQASITDWMDFTYIHGEVHSAVVDSARSYVDAGYTGGTGFRTVYRRKYFASHVLQVSPWNWMDLSLGESIIYSDREPQLMYLLPVMFFKNGEHFNRDTDNAHLFGSLHLHATTGLSVYASMFIDELHAGAVFDAERNRNWFASSVGARLYDLPIENLELFAEYTRNNPWVYAHRYRATTYTNNGFGLGHWAGQNADLLTAEMRYRPTRSSFVSVVFQSYRKGEDSLTSWGQYNPPTEQFLFGRNRRESSVTVSGSYQFARDAFLEASYRRSTLTDEQNPPASYNDRNEFLLRLRYGVW